MFLIPYSVIRLHSAGSRLQPVPLPIQEPPATGPVSGQVKVIPDALILERQNSKHESMKRNCQLFLKKYYKMVIRKASLCNPLGLLTGLNEQFHSEYISTHTIPSDTLNQVHGHLEPLFWKNRATFPDGLPSFSLFQIAPAWIFGKF